jgi:hypothetical protein
MIKNNNAEAGYWASPLRAGFLAHVFRVMLLIKAICIYYDACLEAVSLKTSRT